MPAAENPRGSPEGDGAVDVVDDWRCVGTVGRRARSSLVRERRLVRRDSGNGKLDRRREQLDLLEVVHLGGRPPSTCVCSFGATIRRTVVILLFGQKN